MKRDTALDSTDVNSLVAAISSGWVPEYFFFWGHRAREVGAVGKWCLSQWWVCAFEVDGQSYSTAEHFMMAEKARLFGDEESRRKILDATEPAVAKQLGRGVRGFDEQAWSAKRMEILVRANAAKFGQNPPLEAFLLSTGRAVLVEASPRDRIWGYRSCGESQRCEKPRSLARSEPSRVRAHDGSLEARDA